MGNQKTQIEGGQPTQWSKEKKMKIQTIVHKTLQRNKHIEDHEP